MPVRNKQNWMLAIVALAFSALVSASSITYNVNLTIGTGSATGFITTDGTIGALSAADITNFDLIINDGTASMTLLGPLSGNNSYVTDFGGSALSATAVS